MKTKVIIVLIFVLSPFILATILGIIGIIEGITLEKCLWAAVFILGMLCLYYKEKADKGM